MTEYGFDTADVKLETAGLPEGTYKVMISKEEIVDKPDNTSNPRILNVYFEVVEGDLKGKSHRQGYNLWNANQTAVNIAKQAIKKIAVATGREVSQSSPLKGRALSITIRKQPKNPDYMEISEYAGV